MAEEDDVEEGGTPEDETSGSQNLELSEIESTNGEAAEEEAPEKAPMPDPTPPLVPEQPTKGTPQELEAVYDIPVKVSAVLGKSTMQVNQLLKLGRGAVVELDRKVGEAIDIYVNNRLVARGEVVVIEDRLGVTMTEIIKTERK